MTSFTGNTSYQAPETGKRMGVQWFGQLRDEGPLFDSHPWIDGKTKGGFDGSKTLTWIVVALFFSFSFLLGGCGGGGGGGGSPGDVAADRKFWGVAELIETDNAGPAEYHEVAMGPDGSAMAIWAQDDGTRYNIWCNRYDGTGWGTAELIEADDTGDASQPYVAMGADGSALAVWAQSDGTRYSIWSNRFDGTSWVGAGLIETDDTGSAVAPQVAISADGSALAVWTQSDGTGYNIWANRRDASGWVGAELIETNDAGNADGPLLAMSTDGTAVVVWRQFDGTYFNIWSNRYDGSGWVGAGLIETYNAGHAFAPRVAMGPDGSALAVWEQFDGTRRDIWSNRCDGSGWGTAELIETDNAGLARRPQIAMSSDGSAMAVWHQFDGTHFNILANRFNGSAWGVAELVETNNLGHADNPWVAMSVDGSALAVWSQFDSTRSNIWANRFDGTSWGTAELIETDYGGNADFPQVTMGADGSATAVWSQLDGTRLDIWANRYE